MIGETILHYRILQKLGEGGMGIVYKAEDTKLKREVAIKFLPHHVLANAEEKQRFEIEAQAAAALNHPNITTIYSIEESKDDIFIVMEYINGIELKEKIKKGLPSLDESLSIISQIAEGLKAAHQKGIVHRDIKSSNIMLNSTGQVKIMDFGLAKVKGVSHITKLGTTLGTTAYMSPEQARGEHVDHRTDIWSLGVIMYEMFTGRTPFKGEFDQAVIYSILNEEPDSIGSNKEGMPVKLESIISKMLAKEPESRYKNIDEFLIDLREGSSKTEFIKENVENTIAVLPFENMSSDKEIDFITEGIAEEIIVNLTGLKDMKVVPRTNSFQFKGSNKDVKKISRELGARYIITGSVQKFQDNIRISVQRIDILNNRQLWANTYKGKIADIFDIQGEVSKQAVEATIAFDCYLQARNFLTRRTKNSIKIAIDLFQKAVNLDPKFSAAYAGLGEAYSIIYRDFEREEVWLDKALEVGHKAVEHDPTSSESYAALGMAYFGKNNLSDALDATKKSIELDSNNYNAYWILARIYHTTDRESEAAEALEKLVKINPEFLQAYQDLLMYYERLGEKIKYNQALEASLNIYPKYLAKHPDDAYRRMSYAVSLAYAHRNDEAKTEGNKSLKVNPKDPIMMYYGACLYSRLNENKHAVELLKNAIENGYENFEWIKRDPDFENIRKEPVYIELMKDK